MYYATGARSGIPHNCCIDLDLAYHHFSHELLKEQKELCSCRVLGCEARFTLSVIPQAGEKAVGCQTQRKGCTAHRDGQCCIWLPDRASVLKEKISQGTDKDHLLAAPLGIHGTPFPWGAPDIL